MWSPLFIAAPERFDHDFGIDPVLEPFHRQALVAELAVEALVQSILPRLAGIYRDGLDVGAGELTQDRPRYELRAVVRTQVPGRTINADQPGQHLDHAAGADTAGDVDREALPGVLVDHGQALELLAVGAGREAYRRVAATVSAREAGKDRS